MRGVTGHRSVIGMDFAAHWKMCAERRDAEYVWDVVVCENLVTLRVRILLRSMTITLVIEILKRLPSLSMEVKVPPGRC